MLARGALCGSSAWLERRISCVRNGQCGCMRCAFTPQAPIAAKKTAAESSNFVNPKASEVVVVRLRINGDRKSGVIWNDFRHGSILTLGSGVVASASCRVGLSSDRPMESRLRLFAVNFGVDCRQV